MELPPDDDGEPLGHHVSLDLDSALKEQDLTLLPDPLPQELDDEGGYKVARCCCTKDCITVVKATKHEELSALRDKLNKMSHVDQDIFLMNYIAQTRKVEGTESGRHKYCLCGVPVCLKSFGALLGVGPNRIQKLTASCAVGVPPTDMRSSGMSLPASSSAMPARTQVDAFFHWLYTNIAEPLAETKGECLPEDDDCAVALNYLALASDGFPEHDLDNPVASCTATLSSSCAVKWLAPTTLNDLYSLYTTWETGSTAETASWSTFYRAWHGVWKNKQLRIRENGQHARCTTCAELSKRLASCHDVQEKADLVKARQEHLTSMMSDRDLEMVLNRMSESSSEKDQQKSNGILKLDIDGMDQAKFRCPRNLVSAKALSDHWRPTLHIVGVLIWGALEEYILMPPDLPKDSSTTCTCVCLALDECARILQDRNSKMPNHLVIQADNTCRENKNSTVIGLAAFLVSCGRFESVSVHYHRVGHTHGALDQRFSVLGSLLQRQQVPQDPTDFQDAIMNGLKPIRNRKLVVKQLHGAWNLRDWLAGMGMQFSGLTPNPQGGERHTAHAWRVVQRRALDSYAKSSEWQVREIPEMDYRCEPDDPVLLAKEWESSKSLSQPPLLLVPSSKAQDLDVTSLTLSRLNKLSPREIKEFQKTASMVEGEPWNLSRAAAWLRHLVLKNEEGEDVAPLPIFVLTPENRVVPNATPCGWDRFAPSQVRVREIAAAPATKRRRLNAKLPDLEALPPDDAPGAGAGDGGCLPAAAGAGDGHNDPSTKAASNVSGGTAALKGGKGGKRAALAKGGKGGALPKTGGKANRKDGKSSGHGKPCPDDGCAECSGRSKRCLQCLRAALAKLPDRPVVGCKKCRWSRLGCSLCIRRLFRRHEGR